MSKNQRDWSWVWWIPVIVAVVVLLTVFARRAYGQEVTIPSTAYTRGLMRNTNAANARAYLGVVTSNWAFNSTQLEAPGNALQVKSGATLTNTVIAGGSVGNITNLTPFNLIYTNLHGDSITNAGNFGVTTTVGSNVVITSSNIVGELIASGGVPAVNGPWGTNVFDPNGSFTNGLPGYSYTHTATNGSFTTVVYSNTTQIVYKSKGAFPLLAAPLTAVAPATGALTFNFTTNIFSNSTPVLQLNGGTGLIAASGAMLDMGPFYLLSYPPNGNTHHYESPNVVPMFYDSTNSGIVRHIWFTSYGPGTNPASWYNRTNIELRIYTDFGTNFAGTGSTNPSLQYLNFRAPINVLLGSTYRPTNQSFIIEKDTRYLRTIESSNPDGGHWSIYSFGLNMAAPYTNGMWISLVDNSTGLLVQSGFTEVDWNNCAPSLPYMNWRLRSYTTNGIWGDGTNSDAGPTPFLQVSNGPGVLLGLMLSCRRDTVNSFIFEGNFDIAFNNGEHWTWIGTEDLFGHAWEMQSGGAWGFTNQIANYGFPILTNSLGAAGAPAVFPSLHNDWGVTFTEGTSFGNAVECYRFWSQDAVCWTNGAIGYWTQNNIPGGGNIVGFPAQILSIYYGP